MSAPPEHPGPPPVWPLYRAMVGVGLGCGVLIVGVFQFTAPTIARNLAEALERAVFEVLPEARSSRSFRVTDDRAFEPLPAEAGPAGPAVHAGYDADGRLAGLAIEAEGMGYQDVIRILYGYSFAEEAVIGVRVLESRETPGLGDRVETDPGFRANFERLDVRLAPDGETLAHPIAFVKPGEKEHPWQVDGITGATVTSQAIATILGRSTARWIPQVRRRMDDFREGARP